MSTIDPSSPGLDAEPVLALAPIRSDVVDQLERLRQVADQLSLVTRPGAPAFRLPAGLEAGDPGAKGPDAVVPGLTETSRRRRLHLRRRSA
jgi:hypothetical protein